MLSERIARRYVRALFAQAAEEGLVDRIRPELAELQQLYREHTGLRNTLRDPHLPLEGKRDLLLKLLGEGIPPLLQRFIELLVQKRRLGVLHWAGDLFAELQDEAAGLRQARVVSAMPLTDEQQERLRTTLSRLLGLQIVLTAVVDPAVIGGIMVKVGDLVIDGSIRSRLQGLMTQLRRYRTGPE